MLPQRANRVAGLTAFVQKIFVMSLPTIGGYVYAVPRTRRQFLSCVGIIAGTLSLTAIPAAATPTTIRLVTSGRLTVQRAARRELPNGSAPGGGGVDTYMGTFSVSTTDFPALPITQPYQFTLTGTLSVGENEYVFDNTSLPMASARQANALATDFQTFLSTPSGPFFPDFLPETSYHYDDAGDITILAMADLATVFPDVGPFSALYTDGTYAISTTGLTLVATPQEEAVPEPAAATLLGSALFLLGLMRRQTRRIGSKARPTGVI